MKKFVITDAEKKLLFIVLGIVLLVCAYFFGFTKLNEQAQAIEASNKQDEAEVTRLEGMVSKQAETQAETEQFKQNIEKIIAKYPVAVPQEKAIYLVQQFEDITLMDVDSIAFSMDNTVQNFSGDNAPVGKYANLGISYSASYNSFKDFLKYVTEQEDRTVVPTITANFDETTGLLKGNLNYKMYYLTNTEKEYEEFPPTGIEAGKAGIFYPGAEEPEFFGILSNEE